jgi:hypothetical protein
MLRKRLIALLIMLSLVTSTGTFAYWASTVTGTETTSNGTLTIGSGESVDTTFEITNELNSGGLLVPVTHAVNSNAGAVEAINLSYDVQWLEDEAVSQIDGTTSVADITVVDNVVITLGETVLDATEYANIYALINVAYNDANASKLTLDAAAQTFAVQITMDEPANQAEYDLIANAKISITFTFTIDSSDIVTTDLES